MRADWDREQVRDMRGPGDGKGNAKNVMARGGEGVGRRGKRTDTRRGRLTEQKRAEVTGEARGHRLER
eukprot:778756-Alexandrium_andersonii.AAC.1